MKLINYEITNFEAPKKFFLKLTKIIDTISVKIKSMAIENIYTIREKMLTLFYI